MLKSLKPVSKPPASSRSNDSDSTRANILKVAAREFSDKGLSGARVDEIAEKTNSSKRMIYYYFGGKDGLYRAVLEQSYHKIRAREAEANFEALPAIAALTAHVAHTFDYHAAHPDFVRLVMIENIHRAEHLAHISGVQKRNRNVIAQLQTIIDKGVSEEKFRTDLDPIDLHATISALSFYNVSNRDTFAVNFGRDMAAPEALAQRRQQVIELVLASVMETIEK